MHSFMSDSLMLTGSQTWWRQFWGTAWVTLLYDFDPQNVHLQHTSESRSDITLKIHSYFIALSKWPIGNNIGHYHCIDYLSTTAQCNTLHLKFTLLQYLNAAVSTEMAIWPLNSPQHKCRRVWTKGVANSTGMKLVACLSQCCNVTQISSQYYW